MLSLFLAVLVSAFFDIGRASKTLPAGSLLARQILEGAELGSGNLTSSNVGLLPLTYSQDSEAYYGVISAGNVSLRVALDTGSADLWFASSACTSSACKSVPKYQLAYASGTFSSVNDNNTAFGVSFADTTAASGFVAREMIKVSNVTVLNQAFGAVNSSNVTFGDDISGTLGLGFSRLSTISNTVVNATPFFSTLAQMGQLNYPLFGLSLGSDDEGSLAIGAIDSSIVTNKSLIEWNEVVPFSPFGSESNTSSYLQWAVKLAGISVNGTEITPQPTYPNATANASLALIDIGTNGIYGPYQDVSRIFSLISESRLVNTASGGQWAMPCDSSEIISLRFGETNFTLQPTDYLIGVVAGNPQLCLAWPMALEPSSDGLDWQLGIPFMRTVYSIFSYGINSKEVPMIGFYPLNNSTVESAAAVSSFFSTASATIATTLPNSLLATPSFTTPTYAFNTSVPASVGQIVASGLATSTYSAVLGTQGNASALPTLAPSPTLYTLVLTASDGQLSTTTSTVSTPSVTLGQPAGWTTSGASAVHAPTVLGTMSVLIGAFVAGLLS